jgi:hypothetical protein
MRISKQERIRAELVSAAVDELIRDPEAQPGAIDPEDGGVIEAARDLARLPSLLGEPEPGLVHRILSQVPARKRRPLLRPAWVAVAALAVLVMAMALTPLGQTAVAGFMSVFQLGRTEVRITPVDVNTVPLATAAASTPAIRESLTLPQARQQVTFDIPEPGWLPPGYELIDVVGYSYPHLPAWLPQPLFVELIYQNEAQDALALRVYPIMLGDEANISGMNLGASPIQAVEDVRVHDQPGVLLQLGGDRRAQAVWQEVVWEHKDLVLALSATELSREDLLHTAESVQ